MGRLARSDACLAYLEIESRRLEKALELEQELEAILRKLMELERQLDKLAFDTAKLAVKVEG